MCGGTGVRWDHTRQKYAGDVVREECFNGWKENYSGDVCQTCGTIYQNPMPSDEWIKEYYSSGDYRKEHPSVTKFDHERADRILQLVERFKMNPKSCLDVGCGRGYLLKRLEVYYFARILGLDYDPFLPEIEEVVQSKDDVGGKFDLITCIHVMEHMREPVKELEWMLSKLNDGGTIVLEIPMYMCADLSHLYVPTKVGLEMVLNKLGLEYLWIEDNNICIIVIGDNYSKYTTRKVVYSFESPDFDNKKDYAEWLRKSYG